MVLGLTLTQYPSCPLQRTEQSVALSRGVDIALMYSNTIARKWRATRLATCTLGGSRNIVRNPDTVVEHIEGSEDKKGLGTNM